MRMSENNNYVWFKLKIKSALIVHSDGEENKSKIKNCRSFVEPSKYPGCSCNLRVSRKTVRIRES